MFDSLWEKIWTILCKKCAVFSMFCIAVMDSAVRPKTVTKHWYDEAFRKKKMDTWEENTEYI